MRATRNWLLRYLTEVTEKIRRRRALRRARSLDAGHRSDTGYSRDVSSAVTAARVGAMAHRLGVDPLRLSDDAWLHDDIIRKCASCKDSAACRLWLADFEADDDGYIDICPNAKRFQKLM